MKLIGRKCKCPVCHRIFSGVTTFEAHQVGPWGQKHCVDPESLGQVHNGRFFVKAGSAIPNPRVVSEVAPIPALGMSQEALCAVS